MTELYRPSAGEHPITPPPELVEEWRRSSPTYAAANNAYERHFTTQSAQWGADQELEACCEWLRSKDILEPAIDALRAARRPKPPTLKEQALATLQRVSKDQYPCNYQDDEDWDTIRRALEALDD